MEVANNYYNSSIIQQLCTLHCCGHVFTVGVITRWALDEIKFPSAHRPITRLGVIVTFLHESQVLIHYAYVGIYIYKMHVLLGKAESVYMSIHFQIEDMFVQLQWPPVTFCMCCACSSKL